MDFQKTCPDDETIGAWVDGRLDYAEREALDGHFADCETCRAVALGAASVEAPAATSARKSPDFALTPYRLPIAIAALVLVAVGFAVAPRAKDTPPPPMTTEAVAAVEPPAIRPNTADRFLLHLSTDKPLYRPGEPVFARAVILNAFDRRPRLDPVDTWFQVKSPKGEVIATTADLADEGVAALAWQVPTDAAGGTYTLLAHCTQAGLPRTETTIDVVEYRVPRIKTDLEFLKKAYGPGDRVSAALEATRAEGGAPAGAQVTAVALVEGKEVHRESLRLDDRGRCQVAFALPPDVGDGSGTLALTIQDGGTSETAARSIPIVVNRLSLELFPEGGDLVAEVPCRVYFEARTPKQEPADVEGRVLDPDGTVVARLESSHEGRGRFEFVPRVGTAYRVALDRPAGIDRTFALPPVSGTGVVIASQEDVSLPGRPVHVAVWSPTPMAAQVALFQREQELARVRVGLAPRTPASVALVPSEEVGGVLRVTVFDAEGLPRAERLLFRPPARGMFVQVLPEPAASVPGAHAKVTVRTTDETGLPVRAILGLVATDDAVLTMPKKRERQVRLPIQALLGAEVRELKDPEAFSLDDAESPRRIDLLLGTQGWRRFAFVDRRSFLAAQPDRALSVLAPAVRPLRSGLTNFIPPTVQLVGPDTVSDRENPLFGAEAVEPVLSYGFDIGPDRIALSPIAGVYFSDGRDGDFRARTENLFDPSLGVRLSPLRLRTPVAGGGGGHGNVRQLNALHVADPRPLAGGDVWTATRVPPRLGLLFAGDGDNGIYFGSAANPYGVPFDTFREYSIWWNLPVRLAVRVYAHTAPERKAEEERNDFTETVYWNARLETDADGQATVEFDLSDSITTVRIRADGVTRYGALGSGDGAIEVKPALAVEPKLPIEVTQGDVIDLPVSVRNGTAEPKKVRVETQVTGLEPKVAEVEVGASASARTIVPVEIGRATGLSSVRIRADVEAASDRVQRDVRVVPAGFPAAVEFGGVVESSVAHEVEVPADVVPGSLVTEGALYPSPLASLTAAIARLVREPGGCFEQTSSVAYPNVLALRFLAQRRDADPALVRRARELLDAGYRRLVGFECKEGGFEWFGHDPAHEGLTAYGLMEFTDMVQADQAVDAEMLARTRRWLLSRRDGKGGFLRSSGCCHAWDPSPEVMNAYVVWALLEAGEKGLEREVAALKASALDSTDPYVQALAACALDRAGETDAAAILRARLAGTQGADGAVRGAKTSVTASSGESLDVETTALAALAWLRAPDQGPAVEDAIRWLASVCQGGRFGSTQGTVLALKAIVAYDEARPRARPTGKLTLVLDGGQVHVATVPAEEVAAIPFPDLAGKLGPGRHRIEVRLDGGLAAPYSLSLRFHSSTPASSPRARVSIETSLSAEKVAEGDPVDARVVVANTAEAAVPMAVAVVGLPGGLEPRVDQLKELVKEGRIASFEVRGREVVLYWLGLEAGERKEVSISCLAAVPGRYAGSASRAYLYYADADKAWVPPLRIQIAPR